MTEYNKPYIGTYIYCLDNDIDFNIRHKMAEIANSLYHYTSQHISNSDGNNQIPYTGPFEYCPYKGIYSKMPYKWQKISKAYNDIHIYHPTNSVDSKVVLSTWRT